MSRGGRDLLWTSEPTKTSNLDGIWKLNEINNHLARNEWPTIPDAIDDLNVSVGDTVLDLSWTAPSSNGLPFTLYSIEYTPNGGSSVVVTTSNTSYQLTGLLNDTEYSVRVGAVVGDRVNYSTAVTGTPSGGPSALTFSQTASGCNPSWQVGGIPASSTTIRLTVSGFVEGDFNSVSNKVRTFTIGSVSSERFDQHDGTLAGTLVTYNGSDRFSTSTRYNRPHSFTATIEALDSSQTVVAEITGTSWPKDDCAD